MNPTPEISGVNYAFSLVRWCETALFSALLYRHSTGIGIGRRSITYLVLSLQNAMKYGRSVRSPFLA